MTTAVLAIFAAVFIAVVSLPRQAFLDWLAPSAFNVWVGGLRRSYALVTANFVHLAAWHLALNMAGVYWLGRQLEPLLTRRRFIGLLLGAALVASGTQLALFGNLGIGGSGMGYALFGFGWAVRHTFPQLRAVLTLEVSAAWVGWFLAGWIAPAMNIANGGHLGGLVFGVVSGAATAVAHPSRRRILRFARTALLILAVLAGSFPFWQAGWWAAVGYRAHKAGAYPSAIEAYTTSLQIEPTRLWVRANLVRAEAWSGRDDEARTAFEELQRRDPEKAAAVLEELKRAAKAPWAQ